MASNWRVGERIQGRWQIHKILGGRGKSGMGIVYIVFDHEERTSLALKTFQDEIFALNSVVADRFKQEAYAWINLDYHRNVTEARLVKNIEGKPYLFLEHVSGGDLGDWIGTPGLTQDLPQVLSFAVQFCDGMRYILSKGITAHRDVKPQNCLITQDKALKITDFGLAKVFDDTSITHTTFPYGHGLSIWLSQTGVAAGTCTHMAPEQFDDSKHVDVRADVYSFGVMLYQMVTGRLPYVGRTFEEFKLAHKMKDATPLTNQPPEICRIISRCLEKEPGNRYADFGEIRDELALIYTGLTSKEVVPSDDGSGIVAARLNNKGVSLYELGYLNDALECFETLVELDSSHESGWLNGGLMQEKLGKLEEALACYTRVTEIEPNNETAWLRMGPVLTKLGRHEEAVVSYTRVTDINPDNKQAWFKKGNALYELEKLEEALVCYQRVIEIDPDHEHAWFNSGLALDRLKRLSEAAPCYTRVAEINPDNKQAWLNKGIVLHNLEKLEEALVCYQRVIEIDPGDEDAWFNSALALRRLKRLSEATPCYRRVTEINPKNARAWLELGDVLSELGREEEASD